MRLVYLGTLTAVFLLLPFSLPTLAARDSKGFKPVKTKLMRGGDEAQTMTVDIAGAKDLYLVVTIGPDTYSSDQAIWAEPQLIDKDGKTIDLTTIQPTRAQVGWGKVCLNHNQHSKPLSIAGKTFAKGFGAHGPSMLNRN